MVKIMARIKILGKQNLPKPSKDSSLNKEVPRMKPAGGKPSLPLMKSYNRQGNK